MNYVMLAATRADGSKEVGFGLLVLLVLILLFGGNKGDKK